MYFLFSAVKIVVCRVLGDAKLFKYKRRADAGTAVASDTKDTENGHEEGNDRKKKLGWTGINSRTQEGMTNEYITGRRKQ